MKYRVIGWTYYDNSEILSSDNTIGFAERNAIIDEIRKHKYLFSGWHHQESWDGVVPILNDGRKRCFSQRGWGGVMAEAYCYMNDYDYASFTFYQSIATKDLNFAPLDFDIDEFEPEIIENEDFKVEVTEALFEIAKTKNPFYLEDIDELRYIDENDSITVCCNGEKLFFVVKEIDRNKAGVGLKNASELIKGKYKIIVTHKPENERKKPKLPIIFTRYKAFEMFEEAMEEYNYDVIEAILNKFEIDYIAEKLEKEKILDNLIRFVKEYVNNSYKTVQLIHILKYIDNFELYEEIADKTLETDNAIYISFINYYLEQDKIMDAYILKYVKSIKTYNLFSGSIGILFYAITLKPDNKTLRKNYYKAIRYSRHEGLPIMAGANLFKYLRKEDKRLIELDKYTSYGPNTIMRIIEYLTYPTNAVREKAYPYGIPKIYETNEDVIVDGIKAYQQYVKERFDIEAMMEGMIVHGIVNKCHEMDRYYRGEEYAAGYICALDILTNYKYNLKERALAKYASKFENFAKEIEDVYNR